MKTVLHLTSSRFYGGPERQMLGLAEHLRDWRTVFASFRESGTCHDFLRVAADHGFETRALTHDTPKLLAARAELRWLLVGHEVDVLLCHGYKADLIGQLAARSLRIPVVAVSRGWTAETFKVRVYEALDRRVLRGMDAVVCVSAAQAERVRRAGVSPERAVVIRNAISTSRFGGREPAARAALESRFAQRPEIIVGAAGRLSPEKGFDVLVRTAAEVTRQNDRVGFIVFGEGAERPALERQIAAAGLQERFLLAGFTADLDAMLPALDILALPSFTEGLPNVVLEAFAAAVPVVATSVGGVPEVVDEGVSGLLAPAGDHAGLARGILTLAADKDRRARMADHGRRRVEREFSFTAQAAAYDELFAALGVKRDPADGSQPRRANKVVEVAGTHG